MSEFGDWWVATRDSVEKDFEGFFSTVENDATTFVEALTGQIETVGPALLSSIASAAIAGATTDGKLDISAAISAGIAAAKTQGLVDAETAVAGAVAALSATVTATATPVAVAPAEPTATASSDAPGN